MTVDQLVNEQMPLAKRLAGMATDLDRDAAFSAAMKGLLKAANRWKPNWKASFKTISWRMIMFALGDARKENSHKGRDLKHVRLDAIPDCIVPIDSKTPALLALEVEDEERLEKQLESAMAVLSERERDVVRSYFLLEEHWSTTANRHRLSESYLIIIRAKALRKLQEILSIKERKV